MNVTTTYKSYSQNMDVKFCDLWFQGGAYNQSLMICHSNDILLNLTETFF